MHSDHRVSFGWSHSYWTKNGPEELLSKGQVLELEVKVDPSILGGMIVRIGEKYADMSARTKIQKLSRAMREVFWKYWFSVSENP